MTDEFKKLITESDKILITSHISPDPDAVSSVLLLGTTLKANFPDKAIKMVLEERPSSDLSFLDGFSELEFSNLLPTTQDFKPDLFVMVDAANFYRCSRFDADQLSDLIAKNKTKVAIVDHHEKEGSDKADVYINNLRPAAVQELYELLFAHFGLKKPAGYAQTTLLGILTDTQRHKYFNPHHRITYAIVSDLIDAGASIEDIEDRLERYNKDELEVFVHLISNINGDKGRTKSFITDEFTNSWLKNSRSIDSFKKGCNIFTDQFLKNFEDNLWGYIIHPELQEWPGTYGISLRSSGDAQDVSKLARALGGGGHKPAAGAKFKAKSIQEALKFVEDTIVKLL